MLESAGSQRWSESFAKQGYYEWHVTVARKPIVARIHPHDVEKFCSWNTSIIWEQFPRETDVLTLHGLADILFLREFFFCPQYLCFSGTVAIRKAMSPDLQIFFDWCASGWCISDNCSYSTGMMPWSMRKHWEAGRPEHTLYILWKMLITISVSARMTWLMSSCNGGKRDNATSS